jgi:hypothetical protein
METLKDNGIIELTAYYTWMGDDGIARTKVKLNAEITIMEARENSVAVNSLSKGSKFPLLIDSRNIRSISKEARDFFAIRERESFVNSFAIIIQSPISKVIGNFFIGLNKPTVPVRLFNNEESAVKWLKEFL